MGERLDAGEPFSAVAWPDNDQVLASAVRFLINGGEIDAATLLLSCYLGFEQGWSQSDQIALIVTISGPRAAYDAFCEGSDRVERDQVKLAIEACLHRPYLLHTLEARAHLETVDPDWRNELLELVKGRSIDNQALPVGPKPIEPIMWNNLKFRSRAEVSIAEAFETAGVMFLPNCWARLNTPQGRRNRESDFLVCQEVGGGSSRSMVGRSIRSLQTTTRGTGCLKTTAFGWSSTSPRLTAPRTLNRLFSDSWPF